MSDSPSNPSAPRATLKLKVPARKPAPAAPAAAPRAAAPPAGKTQGKLDAHWSDEYKRRMQEDMDKLVR